MNFKIYLLNTKLEKFYSEAIKEYEKRLSRYCKIQLVQVKDSAELEKKLSARAYKIQITTYGETISSESLADKINGFATSGNSDIAIIIGESEIACDETLTLSRMEMDDALVATIVFEQIYRGHRILKGEPYHK